MQNFDFLSQGTFYSVAVAMSQTLDDLIGPESDEEVDEGNDSDYKPVQRTPTSNRRNAGHTRGASKRSYSDLSVAQTPNGPESLPADSPAGSFAFRGSPAPKKPKLTNAQLRNRNARTANDIDILEGLPIRQWKQVETQLGPPQVLQSLAGQAYFPELPMPRDSHLLPEHSQQLLRLARAPTVRKPLAPPNEDEEDNTADDDRTKDVNRGINVFKWSQIPRHLEQTDVENKYLAKRRPGLPVTHSSLGSGAGAVNLSQAGPTRKTKLKRYVSRLPSEHALRSRRVNDG